jgi:hypothetical protein
VGKKCNAASVHIFCVGTSLFLDSITVDQSKHEPTKKVPSMKLRKNAISWMTIAQERDGLGRNIALVFTSSNYLGK